MVFMIAVNNWNEAKAYCSKNPGALPTVAKYANASRIKTTVKLATGVIASMGILLTLFALHITPLKVLVCIVLSGSILGIAVGGAIPGYMRAKLVDFDKAHGNQLLQEMISKEVTENLHRTHKRHEQATKKMELELSLIHI